MVAAAISFLIGTAALLVASMVFRQSWTLTSALASGPWWAWAGGLLGAFYVLAMVILVPSIGAATTVSMILAGQVLASVLIDNFGWLRIPVHELTIPRVAGAVLVVVGVALVQKILKARADAGRAAIGAGRVREV